MKISKSKLRQIIKEELSITTNPRDPLLARGLGNDVRFVTVEGSREDMMMPAISQADFDAALATDDEKFTGGTPEERLLTLMKARELLAAMSEEELRELSLSLDGETTRALQHLLANPMYGG